jgi:hypothetical protein
MDAHCGSDHEVPEPKSICHSDGISDPSAIRDGPVTLRPTQWSAL